VKEMNNNWFKHELDTIHNPKIQAVVHEHGGIAYAVWWRIVEMLYKNDGEIESKPYIFGAIAMELHLEKEDIIKIINTFLDYDLLVLDGNMYTNNRVTESLAMIIEKKKKRAIAGRKGGFTKNNSSKCLANAKQNTTNDEQNLAIAKQIREDKSRKEKENTKRKAEPDGSSVWDDLFEKAWNAYRKANGKTLQVGAKVEARKQFDKIADSEKELALHAVRCEILKNPDGSFRPYLSTLLNASKKNYTKWEGITTNEAKSMSSVDGTSNKATAQVVEGVYD
jgi:uncharacterized protein YdaU (DUF1376 family)